MKLTQPTAPSSTMMPSKPSQPPRKSKFSGSMRSTHCWKLTTLVEASLKPRRLGQSATSLARVSGSKSTACSTQL